MPTGRWPETSSSTSAARSCRSRSVVRRQGAVELVDPAVDTDLVTLVGKGALFLGVQLGDHGGDEEARVDVVLGQNRADARDRHAGAIFTLAELAGRGLSEAERRGLVVRIEGERNGAAGAVLPGVRFQRATGPHLVDNPAPALLPPLPGKFLGLGGIGLVGISHGSCSSGLVSERPPSRPPIDEESGSCRRSVCSSRTAAHPPLSPRSVWPRNPPPCRRRRNVRPGSR